MGRVTLKPVYIQATTLPDSWFQVIWNLLDHGREWVIARGSYAGQKRLELDYVTVHLKHPGVRPLLPDIPVVFFLPVPWFILRSFLTARGKWKSFHSNQGCVLP